MGPPETTPVCMAKAAETDLDVMSEVEKMKCKSKFDKYLTWTDKIEIQLKQVFSKYYGQVDDNKYYLLYASVVYLKGKLICCLAAGGSRVS